LEGGVAVGDERKRQLHRRGRDAVEDHGAHPVGMAPQVLEPHARAVGTSPEVHLGVAQRTAHLVEVLHRRARHVKPRVRIQLGEAFRDHGFRQRVLEQRLQRRRLILLAIEGVGVARSPLVEEHHVARVVQAHEQRHDLGGKRHGALARAAGQHHDRIGILRAQPRGNDRQVELDAPARLALAILPDLIGAAAGGGVHARKAARLERDRGMRGIGSGGAGRREEARRHGRECAGGRKAARREALHGMCTGCAEV
jgi:hypothetical protein